MRRRLATVAFTIALGALASVPPLTGTALAAGSDAAATEAYVRADYQLVRLASSRIPNADNAIQGVRGRVSSECPRAGANSPQDPESTELSDEVIGAMVTSAIHGELPAIRAFVRVASPLRWSSRGLTTTIQRYVTRLKTLASLAEPALCADVRAWAASDYKALGSGTVSFDARFFPSWTTPAWVAIGELPPALARYETAAVRPLAGRAGAREEELTEFEAGEVETWGKIMSALELWP
jgi:hypothetical protein